MNEILIVDKPYGLTSSYVVNKLKRHFGASKAGHSGTLDPLATGVLVVYFDDMTKVIPIIEEEIKTYEVKILLGIETDTLDISGEILNISRIKDYSLTDFPKFISSFIGEYSYAPPSFSAIKVNGVPSYKHARRGTSINLPMRKSLINDIEITGAGMSTISLKVKCSKGTYVRALARDIGEILGSKGTVSSLRRLETGKFNIKDSNQFYSLLNGSSPVFFSLGRLFPLVSIDNSAFNLLSKEVNYKDVDLRIYANELTDKLFVIMVNIDGPAVIVKNKFDKKGQYICSEVKFFSKKK